MLKAVSNPASRKGRSFLASRSSLFGQVCVLVALDFFSGPNLQFPVFFVIPVMLAAWYHGAGLAIRLSIGLAVARFTCHWIWGFPIEVLPAILNNVMRGGVLAGLAYVTALSAFRMNALRARVNQLEARLPICPGCGLVRDEGGAWVPLTDLPVPRSRPSCAACEERTEGPLF